MNFFNNIRFSLKDINTGLITMEFKCQGCGKLMSEPASYFIPTENGRIAKIWEAEFWCEKCNARRLERKPENSSERCIHIINNIFFVNEADKYKQLWQEVHKQDKTIGGSWYELSLDAYKEYKMWESEKSV